MKSTVVFFVRLPEAVHALAREAAALAFPDAKFIAGHSVGEAGHNTAEGRQLLVLGEVAEADISTAAQMTDASDLPRWAVVTLGAGSFDLVESVPIAACTAQLLERVFRSSMLQHELLRENLKLQNDLKTVARRYSHDLRSPLNCIHITGELMKEMSAQSSPSLLPQVEVVQNSLAETFEIIERFSYILRATTEPIPASAFSMEAVVSRVLKQLEDEIRQTGVLVKCPSGWPEVNGVAQWVEVIWKNLLLNAIEHASPVKPIQLGWDRTGDELRFWVGNSGPPVAPNIQSQLFRPFEQLHARTAGGFSLTMVERLAALQGGRCGYERSDDISVFYFTLP